MLVNMAVTYNHLTARRRVILDKLTIAQAMNKFLAFYRTCMFIAVFVRHNTEFYSGTNECSPRPLTLFL